MKREDIIIKYPRTPHIQGSRLQPGDDDLRQRRFSEIAGRFLDTPSRHALISGLPVSSCRVLATGEFSKVEDIVAYLGDSHYISNNHIAHLREEAERLGLDADCICRETDASRTMEGIYIKVEEGAKSLTA